MALKIVKQKAEMDRILKENERLKGAAEATATELKL